MLFVNNKCKILRPGEAKIMADKFSVHKIKADTQIRNDLRNNKQ